MEVGLPRLKLLIKLKKGEFEIDFLMLVAVAGAAYIGKWEEGALLLFLFSIGHALESYAMNKAKKSIESLGELSPKTALVKRSNSVVEIPIEELKVNDIIVIKPNTKIAADVALMSDKIENLPFVIGLSRKSKLIIKQNLWISLGIVAVLIPATILGYTTIGPAVIIHEGSALLVVFNALRLLRYKED